MDVPINNGYSPFPAIQLKIELDISVQYKPFPEKPVKVYSTLSITPPSFCENICSQQRALMHHQKLHNWPLKCSSPIRHHEKKLTRYGYHWSWLKKHTATPKKHKNERPPKKQQTDRPLIISISFVTDKFDKDIQRYSTITTYQTFWLTNAILHSYNIHQNITNQNQDININPALLLPSVNNPMSSILPSAYCATRHTSE